ncbi:MAG: TonB-dependent receptor plug domain-containing protein [Proteobacteria bacterium]|nr:TonB-dependent receptor plug domain-containing protein [Pseudomonadota bacterium]
MHVYRKAGLPGIQRKLLYTAISLSLLPLAGTTFAQDAQIEEILVTGSYIRRSEGFRSASPITQLSVEDIALEGTPNMGDVIHNLSFNQGTTISANAFTGAGNVSTSLNLRGLGTRATLDLVDGYRTINNDINSVLPQIAIQRLDIVTDGAAALYGNEAVAGVVNYVPIKSYDGFKFETMSQEDDAGDYNDVQFSALWGTEFNGIDIVVAGDWREHSRLEMRDRPDTLLSAFVWSSTATPGDYRVPTRDENGVLTGSTATTSDPGCGQDGHDDPTQIKNGEFGWQRSPTNCAYDYGEFWDYRTPLQRGNLFLSATYEFSPDLEVSTQYYFSTVFQLEQFGQSLLEFIDQLWRETDAWQAWDWVLRPVTIIVGIGFLWQFLKLLRHVLEGALLYLIFNCGIPMNVKIARLTAGELLKDLESAIEFLKYPHRQIAHAVRGLAMATAAIGSGIYLTLALSPGLSEIMGFLFVGWGVLYLVLFAEFHGKLRNLPKYVKKKGAKIKKLLDQIDEIFESDVPSELKEWMDRTRDATDAITVIAERVDGEGHLT